MKQHISILTREGKISFSIKENSFLARTAAWKLKAHRVAIVLGNTVHLHNTRPEEFLNDARWLKHELCHIHQFHEHGFFTFILLYLWESMRKGYYNNRFEVEAREKEEESASF